MKTAFLLIAIYSNQFDVTGDFPAMDRCQSAAYDNAMVDQMYARPEDRPESYKCVKMTYEGFRECDGNICSYKPSVEKP